MQWWESFLDRKLSERAAVSFVVACLALATGLLIGTGINHIGEPADAHTPTTPTPVPGSAAGVGGGPQQQQDEVRRQPDRTRVTREPVRYPPPTRRVTRPKVSTPSHHPSRRPTATPAVSPTPTDGPTPTHTAPPPPPPPDTDPPNSPGPGGDAGTPPPEVDTTHGEHQVPDQTQPQQREGTPAQQGGEVSVEDSDPQG